MTVAVRTGSLRHRLVFKRFVRTLDAIGGQSRAEVEVATRWGRVKPTTGYEPFIADNLKTIISHTAEIRELPLNESGTITTNGPTGWYAGGWWGAQTFTGTGEKIQSMIFYYGSRMFKIHGVLRPEEQDGLITLLCSEVVE